MKPVHVLGWGTTSALGVGTHAAIRAMRAAARPLAVPRFSPHLAPTPGEPLQSFEVPIQDDDLYRRARDILHTALDEALAMSGPVDGHVTGVFGGTTGGFFVDGEYLLHDARKTDPTVWLEYTQRGAGALTAHVANRVGTTGPMATFVTACTSSAVAIDTAAAHLRAGTCTRAIVVGYDLLSSYILHGFRSLLLLDASPSKPFDRDRNGLQLGEGCGVVVLGTGADGPFRYLDSDNVLDSGHVTSAAVDGSTAQAVMEGAIRRAGRTPSDIVSIKAHGTGTRDNDLAEGRGIRRLFGSSPPPFASLKGYVGHTLGAAGSLEFALWLAALQEGFLPASIGFSTSDPEIGIAPTVVHGERVRGAHLFNGFGFGGSCVAQVVTDA